ncbi:MAG: TfuA-like protein [Leisingera sp.]
MTAVVFTGPTLPAEDVLQILDATVLPPAAQGDIYRAARQGAAAIGLIDGYFEGVPSVWHKEILWAMEQGIAVFGSASMGALRAAELAAFGMSGVGSIYEDYASGEISDDDEVAVLHSPAELGFAPLSEPMVSVRATVTRATSEAVLQAEHAGELLDAAKALFFHDRNWERILGPFAKTPWHGRFSVWLETGRVDAKREDALEMLRQMAVYLRERQETAGPPPQKTETTLAWQTLVSRIDAEKPLLEDEEQRVLDELRLTPERFGEVRRRAALRCFSLAQAEGKGRMPKRAELAQQMAAHREELGLFTGAALRQWLKDNGLTAETYEQLLRGTAVSSVETGALESRLEPHLLAELRQAGAYAALKSRAASKLQHLSGHRQLAGRLAEPEQLRLLAWYFETQLQRGIPDDLAKYAKSVGLGSREEFYELIRQEFMYHQGCKTQPAPESPD